MLHPLWVYAVAKQWYDDPKSKQLDAKSKSIGKGAHIFCCIIYYFRSKNDHQK